ncbi:hypothetical protein EDC01DRAFT_627697 [Geopyxis carbonaria]|nr:hypothetical protein EDC01DRAFT_627697 [Geopyxis carbonaria]
MNEAIRRNCPLTKNYSQYDKEKEWYPLVKAIYLHMNPKYNWTKVLCEEVMRLICEDTVRNSRLSNGKQIISSNGTSAPESFSSLLASNNGDSDVEILPNSVFSKDSTSRPNKRKAKEQASAAIPKRANIAESNIPISVPSTNADERSNMQHNLIESDYYPESHGQNKIPTWMVKFGEHDIQMIELTLPYGLFKKELSKLQSWDPDSEYLYWKPLDGSTFIEWRSLNSPMEYSIARKAWSSSGIFITVVNQDWVNRKEGDGNFFPVGKPDFLVDRAKPPPNNQFIANNAIASETHISSRLHEDSVSTNSGTGNLESFDKGLSSTSIIDNKLSEPVISWNHDNDASHSNTNYRYNFSICSTHISFLNDSNQYQIQRESMEGILIFSAMIQKTIKILLAQ